MSKPFTLVLDDNMRRDVDHACARLTVGGSAPSAAAVIREAITRGLPLVLAAPHARADADPNPES